MKASLYMCIKLIIKTDFYFYKHTHQNITALVHMQIMVSVAL